MERKTVPTLDDLRSEETFEDALFEGIDAQARYVRR